MLIIIYFIAKSESTLVGGTSAVSPQYSYLPPNSEPSASRGGSPPPLQTLRRPYAVFNHISQTWADGLLSAARPEGGTGDGDCLNSVARDKDRPRRRLAGRPETGTELWPGNRAGRSGGLRLAAGRRPTTELVPASRGHPAADRL